MPLTEEQLTARFWSFGQAGQPPLARYLRLAAGGRLAGYSHDNEKSWALQDGVLVFLDRYGCVTTRFAAIAESPEGRLTLSGAFLPDAAITHELWEVPPFGGLCPSEQGVDPVTAPTRRRRNLVVLRADENSLHPSWPRDVADAVRDWDLCVSFYGKTEHFPPQDFAEYRALQNGPDDRKFAALHRLLHRDSPLLDYDYIMLPDDDVMLRWRDLNEIFAICRDYDLQLAQPALAPEGHITHRLTRQNPRFLLRYTSFVELMIPVFSRRALRDCLPSVPDSRSGFGLDHVWPRLIGEPVQGIAIIDRVAVAHTRPIATHYPLRDAIAEGLAVEQRYGVTPSYLERGGIFAAWAMPPKT